MGPSPFEGALPRHDVGFLKVTQQLLAVQQEPASLEMSNWLVGHQVHASDVPFLQLEAGP